MVKKELYSDIYKTIVKIREDLAEQGVILKSYQEDALDSIQADYAIDKTPGMAYYNLEDWLYTQKDKDISIKSAMAWGGLWVLHKMNIINWDEMRTMYGEFMSKIMEVR